jgi:hypothetical protein
MEIFLGWKTTDDDVLVLFKHFINDYWFRQSVSSGIVVINRTGYCIGINSVRYACLRQKHLDEEY